MGRGCDDTGAGAVTGSERRAATTPRDGPATTANRRAATGSGTAKPRGEREPAVSIARMVAAALRRGGLVVGYPLGGLWSDWAGAAILGLVGIALGGVLLLNAPRTR